MCSFDHVRRCQDGCLGKGGKLPLQAVRPGTPHLDGFPFAGPQREAEVGQAPAGEPAGLQVGDLGSCWAACADRECDQLPWRSCSGAADPCPALPHACVILALFPTEQMSGSIKYNGVEASEFVLARTVALVEQIDYHIPNLTVREHRAATRRASRAAGPPWLPVAGIPISLPRPHHSAFS